MKGHQVELETMLEYLINGENDEATKLFHQIVVEKSRTIYTESIGDDLDEAEEELDEEEVEEEDEKLDEDFGGDPKADFADEIEADQDEVDSEEQMEDDDENDDAFDFDAEAGGEEGFDAPDADGEVGEDDRLEDIEAAIVELSAEFHQVASGLGIELDAEDDMMGDAPGFDDEVPGELEPPMDMGMEDEDDFAQMESALAEATAFLKNVADAGMKQEGNEVGKGSKAPVNTKSINDESSRKDYGGKPVKFAGGTPESGSKEGNPTDENCEDNVNVKPASAPSVKRKPEGEDKSAGSPLNGAPGRHK